jgi:hypothetical protein
VLRLETRSAIGWVGNFSIAIISLLSTHAPSEEAQVMHQNEVQGAVGAWYMFFVTAVACRATAALMFPFYTAVAMRKPLSLLGLWTSGSEA